MSTAADRLFQAFRDAISAVDEAEAELHCAREACSDAEKHRARLSEAVRLHVEEGMDAMQASIVADSFDEPTRCPFTGAWRFRAGEEGKEFFRPGGNPRSKR